MSPEDRIPVIVGVGEIVDRPEDPSAALEPVALMAEALRRAERDAGGGPWLAGLDTLDLVGQITWRYADPVGDLKRRLAIAPPRAMNESMGGETPIRLLHEAALRISRGEARACAIVGGEAMHALGRARKAGLDLPWTPPTAPGETVRLEGSRLTLSPAARTLGLSDPAHIYPLYENAWQAAQGQSPGGALAASAALWARFARVAAANPYAWIRTSPSAEVIGAPTPDNRRISWPYTKLMVANPTVNQAAALMVTSLASARAAGIPDDRLIHIWGGGAAQEADDFLHRDAYDHSTAQAAALDRAVEIAGGDSRAFDAVELYSCFPIVPKMALARLDLKAGVEPTVTGGITFFGGPMNNYMSHATAAMVRALRGVPDGLGLLYGQGGVFNKHHTLVVSRRPAPGPMDPVYSVQETAQAARTPAPAVIDLYEGPALLETWTVVYDRSGAPTHGVVIARTPDGARLAARVPGEDAHGVGRLTDLERTPVGAWGAVRMDGAGDLIWSFKAAPPLLAEAAAAARGAGPAGLSHKGDPERNLDDAV